MTKRHRQNHHWIEKTELHHWWWVTTLPKSRFSTRLLWSIAHRRWEIENDLFHTLVTYRSLDHFNDFALHASHFRRPNIHNSPIHEISDFGVKRLTLGK